MATPGLPNDQATVLVPPSELGTLPPACLASGAAGDGRPPAPPGYILGRELGRGGMGVVYEAQHLRLGRVVALKMILAGGHAGADDLTRFRTEAEAIARLQHPNIVQIFEVGEQNGLPFFSLEFCGGGSLERKLAGHPMAADEAARLVACLARAMHAAHVKGIIHRDLKPGNILFTEDGAAKITDFGLAKKIGDAGCTAAGSIMGTPSYMSPEQATGTLGIGPAADIYALGAILYECLTGRPPFRAATPLDTVMQVATEDPVPPRRLQSRVPIDLETVCLKCLRKEPGRHYARAGDLADDLERYLAGEPIQARPVGLAERAVRWCRRNPVVACLAALVVVLLLASIATLRASLSGVEALARRNQRVLAESLAGRLDERLHGSAWAVGLLARMAEVKALLAAPTLGRVPLAPPALGALDAIIRSNPDFSSAFILDGKGDVAVSTNPRHEGRNFAFRDYYREGRKGPFRSKVLVGTTTGQAGMYYSAPVVGPGGDVVGVAVVKLEAAAIWGIVDGLDVSEAGGVFVVDEDGIVVAHQDRAKLFHSVGALPDDALPRISPRARFQADTVPSLGLPELARVVAGNSSGLLDYTRAEDGSRRAAAHAPLRETGWAVVIDVDERVYAGPRWLKVSRDSQAVALALAILGVLAVPALRWWRSSAGK